MSERHDRPALRKLLEYLIEFGEKVKRNEVKPMPKPDKPAGPTFPLNLPRPKRLSPELSKKIFQRAESLLPKESSAPTESEPPGEKPKRAPLPRKIADPEVVRRVLAHAKSLLAPSPEKLKEMPTNSKRIH